MSARLLAPILLGSILIAPPAVAGQAAADPDATAAAATKQDLLNGYRRYHSVCNHCHGPDGLGSSFGPSLVQTPPDPAGFRAAVRDGARGQSGVMKGFAENADVMQHLDAILAYVEARSTGKLGRGRPR